MTVTREDTENIMWAAGNWIGDRNVTGPGQETAKTRRGTGKAGAVVPTSLGSRTISVCSHSEYINIFFINCRSRSRDRGDRDRRSHSRHSSSSDKRRDRDRD